MQTEQRPVPILDLKPGYEALKGEILAAIERVCDSTAFIMGPDVAALESEVAAYLGVRHAIGVNSGTDALVIGMRAAGVQPGDEVITTPFSFFATAEAISVLGAEPVFVDVDENTYNIQTDVLTAAITPKTKAILPVHLYGHVADMDAILEIASRHGLKVVEDCAQSFGARDPHGRQSGTIGDVGAFSFFPSKTLGAFGDGGIIATNDDAVAGYARALRVHGSVKKYHNEFLGYNSRLDTMQAAILRVKLPHIDKWNAARRRVAARYNHLLSDAQSIRTPSVSEGDAFHQYTIQVPSRDDVKAKLAAQGISTMIYYPVPLDQLPIYAGRPVCPVSARLAKSVLSLPIWPEIDNETVELVARAVIAAVDA
jgi:dTDP-4-amino-4,6-dideoxygalactose transaminase